MKECELEKKKYETKHREMTLRDKKNRADMPGQFGRAVALSPPTKAE